MNFNFNFFEILKISLYKPAFLSSIPHAYTSLIHLIWMFNGIFKGMSHVALISVILRTLASPDENNEKLSWIKLSFFSSMATMTSVILVYLSAVFICSSNILLKSLIYFRETSKMTRDSVEVLRQLYF